MRRHHHLIADYEVVDDRVMPIELPSPRLRRRRFPHDADEVQPLAQELMVVSQFRKRSFKRMTFRVSANPLSLSEARIRPKAKSRCASLIS